MNAYALNERVSSQTDGAVQLCWDQTARTNYSWSSVRGGETLGRKERVRERDWGAEGGRWGEIRTACGAALAPRPTHSHSDSQAKLVLFKNCRASETQGEGSSEFGERARRERRSRESCLRRSERSAPGSWSCWRRMGGTMPAAQGEASRWWARCRSAGGTAFPRRGRRGAGTPGWDGPCGYPASSHRRSGESAHVYLYAAVLGMGCVKAASQKL